MNMETYRGNHEELHKAIDDFKDGKSLSDSQKNLLIEILELSENNIYPSKHSLELQVNRIKVLDNIEYDGNEFHPNKKRWDRIMNSCTEFESKFC